METKKVKKQVKKNPGSAKKTNKGKEKIRSNSKPEEMTALAVIENPHKKVSSYVPIKTVDIPVQMIVLNDNNPRKFTDDTDVMDLVNGISKNGLINPITVRKFKDNEKFELVAGERRFRACKILGFEKIPCIIKDYDDRQSLDVMMDENLTRQPLKPMDEARQYKKLIWEEKVTIKDVALRFGQKPAYIYSRLSLLNMIPEIEDLVNKEKISLSAATEISKYSFGMQKEIFNEHLAEDSYHNWLAYSAKEIRKRLEENYSTLLSGYKFDKTECAKCEFNSEFLSLFPTDKSFCKNRICLETKQEEYITSQAIGLAKEYPEAEINIPPHVCYDDNITGQFIELGIPVTNELALQLPQAPVKPDQKEFPTEEEYIDACQTYRILEKNYEQDKENLETAIREGRAKYVIDLSNSEPGLKYINIDAQEVTQPEIKATKPTPEKEPENTEAEKETMISRLQRQDEINKKICQDNIDNAISYHLKQSAACEKALTEFENRLLYYILIESMRNKNLAMLNLTSIHTDYKKRFEITQELTDLQKGVIVRDFIIKYFSIGNGYGKELMRQFMESNYPETLDKINKEHLKKYQEQHEKIEKHLHTLMPEISEIKEENRIQPERIEEKTQIKENLEAEEIQPETESVPVSTTEDDTIAQEAEVFEVDPEDGTEEDLLPDEIIMSPDPVFDDTLPSVPVIINQQPYYS